MFLFLKRIKARARNDAGERIESLRFSVPALRVGVLEYGAGQLQTGDKELDGKPVKLYYPPEAVSDEKFLKSLETAPVVVGGHDSTTSENNKKIDGWAHNVAYDEAQKAAVISGVVKGAKEVAYIKTNLGSSGFGASAFVDIYSLKIENGMTPDGQEYNAIAGDLRATHVALAPNVRDPENKIKVTNAVCINTEGATMTAENAVDYKSVVSREIEDKIRSGIKAAEADGNKQFRLVFDSSMERMIDRWESRLTPEEYRSYSRDRAEAEIEKKASEMIRQYGKGMTLVNMDIDVVALTKMIKEGVKNAMTQNAGEDVRFYEDMKDKITRIKSDRARGNLLRYLDNYKNASDKQQKANYAREVLRAYETERYKES